MTERLDTDRLVDQLAAANPDAVPAKISDDQLRGLVRDLPDFKDIAGDLSADDCYEISMKWISLEPDADERAAEAYD